MTQKTFKTIEKLEVGEQVLLYSKTREGGKEIFHASKELAKTGYPGNIDGKIFRFHGWRGTSYGTSTYAYGVREVKKVTPAGEDDMGRTVFSVTVGKDMHEDWN